MSDSDDGFSPADLQLIDEFIFKGEVGGYAFVSASAWYLYDYLLTLNLEISSIWKRQLNFISILFFANRYAFVLSWIFLQLSSFAYTERDSFCKGTILVWSIGVIIGIITSSVTFILRTYAIYGRSLLILLLLIPLSLARLALSIYGSVITVQGTFVLTSFPVIDSLGSCTAFLSSRAYSKIYLANEFVVLAFDGIVFLLTLWRTWMMSREAKAAGIKNTISKLLLRDGSLYFGSLLLLVLIRIIITFTETLSMVGLIISNLTQVIEAILINRLILNLRSYQDEKENAHPASKTDMIFRSVVRGGRNPSQTISRSFLANIGEPLAVDEGGGGTGVQDEVNADAEELEEL